jgi:hypothetical protein
MKTSRRRNRRRIHADTAAFDANQKASIANYIASFQQEYLVCADATICSRAEHFTVDGSLIEPRGPSTRASSARRRQAPQPPPALPLELPLLHREDIQDIAG